MQQQEYRPGQDPIATDEDAKAYISWLVPEQLRQEALEHLEQLRCPSGGFPLLVATSMIFIRVKHNPLVATCEACRHLYMKSDGYYEPGEYSYCKDCCKW